MIQREIVHNTKRNDWSTMRRVRRLAIRVSNTRPSFITTIQLLKRHGHSFLLRKSHRKKGSIPLEDQRDLLSPDGRNKNTLNSRISMQNGLLRGGAVENLDPWIRPNSGKVPPRDCVFDLLQLCNHFDAVAFHAVDRHLASTLRSHTDFCARLAQKLHSPVQFETLSVPIKIVYTDSTDNNVCFIAIRQSTNVSLSKRIGQ